MTYTEYKQFFQAKEFKNSDIYSIYTIFPILPLAWKSMKQKEGLASPRLIHDADNSFFSKPAPCHFLQVDICEHPVKPFWNPCACNVGFNRIRLKRTDSKPDRAI